jgi:hypothetical protein
MEFMEFLDKVGLGIFFAQLKKIFGYKSALDNTMNIRQQYLLEINYEQDLAFNTEQIIIDNSPYVGSARVGSTRVA